MSNNMVTFLVGAFVEPDKPEHRSMRFLLTDLVRMAESGDRREWTHRIHRPGDRLEFVYKRGRRVFCRLEPKLMVEHGDIVAVVHVFVRGATASELQLAGDILRRKNAPTCVAVRNRRGAKALAPLIRRAFAQAGDTLKRK